MCAGIVKQDKEKGKFPVKLRDEAINSSIGLLKGKGLFPDKDDDSDEMATAGACEGDRGS